MSEPFQDIEDLGKSLPNSNHNSKTIFSEKTIQVIKELYKYDLEEPDDESSKHKFSNAMQAIRKTLKYCPNKTQLSAAYQYLVDTGEITPNETIRKHIKAKEMRGLSGVIVISVITSPYPQYTDAMGNTKTQRFSCRHDCHYCPRELDNDGREVNARSYLSDEPTVARGLRYKYDPIGQYNDRAGQYQRNGHHVDKIEIIVLGGTWTEYPRQYQETYIRDIFYAANVFYERGHTRHKFSLTREQQINETSKSRIIGLTLEMRPDSIDPETIQWLRYLGCTRVQLGVQHIDRDILRNVNRGCYVEDAERALKQLKDCGYKVDAHWMPDLPKSSPTIDQQMFDTILTSANLQFDQWKIYPTAVVPWTRIKKWYDDGSYMPYTERDPENLIKLLIDVKKKVPEWIRLNRVVRDIPNTTMSGETYIYAGNKVTNLRQILADRMKKQNEFCRCIRCREPKSSTNMLNTAIVIVRKYASSGGEEYFISIESGSCIDAIWDTRQQQWKKNNVVEPGIIYGFVRLRLNQMGGKKYTGGNQFFPELHACALVRELHVYGQVVGAKKKSVAPQHQGLGKRLMHEAEQIAQHNNYNEIAVISGIGVKNYYRRLGYHEHNTYMIKQLTWNLTTTAFGYRVLFMLFVLFVLFMLFMLLATPTM